MTLSKLRGRGSLTAFDRGHRPRPPATKVACTQLFRIWHPADFPADIAARLGYPIGGVGEILRAASNALGQMAPLWVMSDPRDLGSLSQVRAPHSGLPTIFLYDNVPGGVGFSQKIFEMAADLFAETAKLIRECPCQSGCPACVGPEMEIGRIGKNGAADLLEFAAKSATLETRPRVTEAVANLDSDEGGID